MNNSYFVSRISYVARGNSAIDPPSLKLPSPSRTDLSRDYAGQDGRQALGGRILN